MSACHGLHVDIGRWEGSVDLDRKDRLCPVRLQSSQHPHFAFLPCVQSYQEPGMQASLHQSSSVSGL